MAWSMLFAANIKRMAQSQTMKKIHVVFHDGGGGHRNAAVALQTIAAQQGRDWQVELVQFQDLTDRLDVLRKLTGIRIQQQYNIMLQNGWTLGSKYLLRVLQLTIRLFHGPMVRLLEEFWREHPADLLVSVIPHFNREISRKLERCLPGPALCDPHYRLGRLSAAFLDRAHQGAVRHRRNRASRRTSARLRPRRTPIFFKHLE